MQLPPGSRLIRHRSSRGPIPTIAAPPPPKIFEEQLPASNREMVDIPTPCLKFLWHIQTSQTRLLRGDRQPLFRVREECRGLCYGSGISPRNQRLPECPRFQPLAWDRCPRPKFRYTG